MSLDSPLPLPPGYYLDNFECVLRDVGGRYRDLLTPVEGDRLDAFFRLPTPARRIYVRMLTRQGPWFRPEGFHYPEIEDIPGAIACLAEQGFCALAATAQAEDLVALLRKEEVAGWLRRFGLPCDRALPRQVLADRLLREVPGPRLRDALAAEFPAVAPLGLEWVRLLFFLFFGNGEQDLSAFVLADLGRVRYEAYAIDPADRLFQTRRDVDFLMTLREVREAFEAGVAAGDPEALERLTDLLLAMEPNPGVRQQRRFHRLLNEVGREWERRGQPARALASYALSERPPARERRVRVLAAQGLLGEAAALAVAMAAAPADVSEERFARQFLRRTAGKDNLAARWVLDHPEPPPVPETRLALPRHPSGSVERAALAAAEREGWQGFFTENVLWNGLFGLAFWEQLFAPVPGAFQHRMQAGPADLAGPGFHARRGPALEARLLELQAPGALARELLTTAERKRGLANVFVNWRGLGPDLLEAALEAVPAGAILSVLRTMAPNPLAFASGFPDLLLIRPRERQCLLWEVKGPGDALRPEQERWLKHFNQAGVEARIAWVKYLEGG